ncbi:MAG: TonB-dependent siderophore receptor [Rhizobiales bacterium]|nr:TonB-dependent siderophore receptor [Hyphomicrobiales bacterium]
MSRLKARHLLLAGASGLALAASQPAFAQQAAETELRPVLVEGRQARSEDDSGVGEVKGVVAKKSRTGSKTATEIKEIPQSVSVVGREQIDMQSPQNLDEALRYVPGVNPSTYGTDSDTDWVFVRGFQADQTGVFLDGLSFYQTGFGTFLMDPFFLERIEVVKGPSSALYGGGNPGGFINYVSKRPGERHRYVETGVNSFGNGYVAADIGDKVNDVFSYRVNGKLSGGGWETDQSQDIRGTIAPSFKWQPDEATSLTVLASLSRTDLVHTSTGFLPYYGTVVPNAEGYKVPRDFFYGDKDVEQYDRTQAMLGYEFSHTFDNDWSVRQNLRYGAVSLQEDGLYSNGVLTGTSLGRYRWAHDTDVNTFTVDNQLEGKVETGALEHTLLFGADYRWYKHKASTFYDGGVSPIDILNPVYGGVYGPPALGPATTTTLNQFGLYAQDQVRFGGGWLATLNGRYDFLSRKLDTSNLERSDGAFTGRAGLAYEFANGLTPYVSYSTSFSPTTSDNGAGSLMEPETGRQWEAGVKYAPTWFDGLLTAAVFDLTKQNVASSAGAPGLLEAIGEVRVRGVELGAQADLANGLKLIGGLTYLDAKVTTAYGPSYDLAPAGATPIQVPDLTASLWLDYAFQSGRFEGLSVGAGLRYVGESWADRANTLKVPDAAVVDAAIRYDRDNWGAALNVANLFDKEYVSSCLGAGFFGSCGYGAGRTFTLKAHVNW